MRANYLLYILILLSVLSCSKPKKNNEVLYKLRFIKEINNPEIACITNIVGAGNNFYVGDWGNCKIHKFNYNDSLEMGFGNKGKGPREFVKISDIALDKKGNIFVADQGLARIQKFDPNGKYLSSFNTAEGTIFNLGVRYNGNIITNVIGHDYSFCEYDKDGNVLSKFVKTQAEKDFILGALKNMSRIYVKDQNTYRIPYNSPQIYDISNNQDNTIYTMQIKNLKNIAYAPSGNEAAIERGSIVFSDMVIDSQFVYLIGGGGDEEKSKLNHFFNIYKLTNWELIDSMWPEELEYSNEGYVFHKYRKFFYFAKVSDNIIYKFELVKI